MSNDSLRRAMAIASKRRVRLGPMSRAELTDLLSAVQAVRCSGTPRPN